jgi:hypothetical protein
MGRGIPDHPQQREGEGSERVLQRATDGGRHGRRSWGLDGVESRQSTGDRIPVESGARPRGGSGGRGGGGSENVGRATRDSKVNVESGGRIEGEVATGNAALPDRSLCHSRLEGSSEKMRKYRKKEIPRQAKPGSMKQPSGAEESVPWCQQMGQAGGNTRVSRGSSWVVSLWASAAAAIELRRLQGRLAPSAGRWSI